VVKKAVNDEVAQPAQEPFGYFRAEPFGWTDCAEGDEGAVALYERPPAAQPEQEPWVSQFDAIERAMEKASVFAGHVANNDVSGSRAAVASLRRHLAKHMRSTEQPEQEPPTCEWSPEDDDTMPGTYRSDCGELWSFIDGGWKENRVRFCHGCGGKVVDGAHGIKEPKP
jgi:hypothetical protein